MARRQGAASAGSDPSGHRGAPYRLVSARPPRGFARFAPTGSPRGSAQVGARRITGRLGTVRLGRTIARVTPSCPLVAQTGAGAGAAGPNDRRRPRNGRMGHGCREAVPCEEAPRESVPPSQSASARRLACRNRVRVWRRCAMSGTAPDTCRTRAIPAPARMRRPAPSRRDPHGQRRSLTPRNPRGSGGGAALRQHPPDGPQRGPSASCQDRTRAPCPRHPAMDRACRTGGDCGQRTGRKSRQARRLPSRHRPPWQRARVGRGR